MSASSCKEVWCIVQAKVRLGRITEQEALFSFFHSVAEDVSESKYHNRVVAAFDSIGPEAMNDECIRRLTHIAEKISAIK